MSGTNYYCILKALYKPIFSCIEESSKDLTGLYSDKSSRRSIDPEKKFGRHADTNFVQKNKAAAACTKKVEYDSGLYLLRCFDFKIQF